LRREELWNGNQEGPLHRIFSDPEHIIRWAWNTHARRLEHVAMAESRFPKLEVVRLRHPREAAAWLADTFG
jgi:hypothetical protein